MYHIYRKDKYAGVTFDKNGGDSDAWINHDIAEKGKVFGRTGKLPAERPVRAGYKFRGWATSPSATVSDFGFTFPVNDDMKLYAIWRNNTEEIPLNDSGNVYAKLDSAKNVNVSAVSTLGNMHIDNRMWRAMITELGGRESALGPIWKDADVNDINFQTEGIYLPAFSENFFAYFPGHINGCEKLKTDNVTRMTGIFSNTNKANPNVSNWNTSKVDLMGNAFAEAKAANPDVSKWDVSNVTHMDHLFFKSGIVKADLSKWNLNTEITNGPLFKCENMLKGCNNLECLKTPIGLKTSVSEANSNFKIVKLKKGSPVNVEKESQNLNVEYTINSSGDKDAMYHIYRKDKHAGITFDKNGGDSEGWVNHEMVEKGKSFKDAGGKEPVEKPSKNGYLPRGWAYNNADKSPTFSDDKDKKIENDLTVYAVYKHIHEIPLNDSGNVYVLPKVETTGRVTLEVKAKTSSGDMTISREKWIEMAKGFGAEINHGYLYWSSVDEQFDICFQTDVKAPQNMDYMFYVYLGNIENLDKLDVSNVVSAQYAFFGVEGKVKGSDFANWKTGNIKYFSGMFGDINFDPDVSSWDMSNAVNLSSMFFDSRTNPDVSNWNVKNVKDISSMFEYASEANPDISKWRFNELENMAEVFLDSKIEKLDMSKWKITSGASTEKAVKGCRYLKYLKTPPGLTLKVGPEGSPLPFKIVRLKKGMPAKVEDSGISLEESDIVLNKKNDKDVAYDVYCTMDDMYVGVTFDVNGGNKESFRNHEIVQHGKSIKESGGTLPEEELIATSPNRTSCPWRPARSGSRNCAPRFPNPPPSAAGAWPRNGTSMPGPWQPSWPPGPWT